MQLSRPGSCGLEKCIREAGIKRRQPTVLLMGSTTAAKKRCSVSELWRQARIRFGPLGPEPSPISWVLRKIIRRRVTPKDWVKVWYDTDAAEIRM